jgi:hypothetical protein
MRYRHAIAVLGCSVVAVVFAVALYVGTLEGGESAAAKKGAAPTAAAEIVQLQARIARLEKRLETLEGQSNIFVSPAPGPALNYVDPPSASPPDSWNGNDGFPPVRFLLIDKKAHGAAPSPVR